MVQYMSILKAYTYLSMGSLSLVEQSLYFRLFLVNNLAGWGSEWFGADNKRLMFETGIGSSATLNKAKQRLKDLGYIDFKSGKKGQPSLYKLMPLHEKFYSPTEQNTEQIPEQNTEQNTEHIIDNRHKTNNTPLPPRGETVSRTPKSTAQEERFAEFWKAYPKKVGKGAALKAYGKIKPSAELHRSMLEAIAIQKQSEQWQKNRGQYIPNPSTWLNQSRWEDELPSTEMDQATPSSSSYADFLAEQKRRRLEQEERDRKLAALARGQGNG